MLQALQSGVSGLKAHQTMLDVAGNNLANVNTTGYKSSRVTFSTMLNQTIREATGGTETIGGTNAMQIGSGVMVGSVDRISEQGSLVATGSALDMAIEGAGFFVLNNGEQDVYTRVGQFAVDSDYFLVDPRTGNRVQRIGSEGVVEGFQDPTRDSIRIPYDTALPAKETLAITFSGNLTADQPKAQRNSLSSAIKYTKNGATVNDTSRIDELDQTANLTAATHHKITGTTYTTGGGTAAVGTDTLDNLDQAAGLATDDTITVMGTDHDGTAVNVDVAVYNAGQGRYKTVAELMVDIDTALNGETLTSIVAGQIQIEDVTSGASSTGVTTTFNDVTPSGATFTVPGTAWTAATTGANGDSFAVAGTRRDGSTVSTTVNLYHATAKRFKTVAEVMADVTAAYANPSDATDQWSVAGLADGEIRLTDSEIGYSQADMLLTYNTTGAGTFTLPSFFKVLTAGGDAVQHVNIEVFDSQGTAHSLSASFVKRDSVRNQWDLVLSSITGDGVTLTDRRINGINFNPDGSFAGMDQTINDTATIRMTFPNDPSNLKMLTFDLGTVGEFDGLTHFGGPSTAVASDQDGYSGGALSNLSISRDGVLVGVFTNGIRRDVAALKVATFQNPAGLKDVGAGYFVPTANSGDPTPRKASEGGAGVIHGGQIENSNVDVAAEFVNLIQAQNGYQANARTIRVANDVLRDLTQLIR